jgi:hypothetical protein
MVRVKRIWIHLLQLSRRARVTWEFWIPYYITIWICFCGYISINTKKEVQQPHQIDGDINFWWHVIASHVAAYWQVELKSEGTLMTWPLNLSMVISEDRIWPWPPAVVPDPNQEHVIIIMKEFALLFASSSCFLCKNTLHVLCFSPSLALRNLLMDMLLGATYIKLQS